MKPVLIELGVLVSLLLIVFSASCSSALAQDMDVITAKMYQGHCCGGFNPDWQIRRAGADPVAMMNQLCATRSGSIALNLGPPATPGGTIGWCGASDDGDIYRCDRDGNPSTNEDLCVVWDAIDCLEDNSLHCSLATDNDCDNLRGNPCDVATGNKKLTLPLFQAGPLSMTLAYNSQDVSYRSHFGLRWTSNFHKELYVKNDVAHFIDGSGKGETWILENSVWVPQNDSRYHLVETVDGYLITDSKDKEIYLEISSTTEIFLVTKEIKANGEEIRYEHSDRSGGQYRDLTITDQYGNSIQVRDRRYVIDSIGNEYKFVSPQSTSRLSEIVFPDGTLSDSDNPRKIFHYENPDFPYHLTGITDENGNRYATYAYDADGKAIATEHSQTTNAMGQERFELEYQ